MRRLYIVVLLSIMNCIALITLAFAVPPVIDFPLDPDIDVSLTAGFGDTRFGCHHCGRAEFAVDIGVGQGTDIIAPFSGTVLYQRFAHGGYSIIDPTTRTEVPIGSPIPSCPTLIRDDDPNSANAVWTISIKSSDDNTVITILHLSEHTLLPNPTAPSSDDLNKVYSVTEGDVVAKTGGALNTPGSGCSTGPHIHLEVTDDGVLGAWQQSKEFEMNVRVGCPSDCQPKKLTVTDLTETSLFSSNFRAPIIKVSPKVDVFFLVDLSSSFADDLPVFKSQAQLVISVLKALNSNTRFGLGKFEDYPIPPFGDPAAGDKAYERLVDLTFDTDHVLATIAGLSIRHGGDGPESQLVALFQAATGKGQDLSGVGFLQASIPPGQQANFRDGATKIFLLWTDAPFHHPGDLGTIPYPGPSFDEAKVAIKALDPPKVIGISSGGGGIADLKAIAAATDALAPAGGIDCNNDGIIDIPAGEPLVCSIGASGEGIAEATIALIEAAASTVSVDSTSGWQTTSFRVTQGQQVSFSTVGTWTVDFRNFPYVDPEGYTPAVDSTIYQGCKLAPTVPYGKLLVRVGDSPSFQVIGSAGTLMADRDGVLAFRIHDADACLVDNAGTVTVTVE